MYCHKARLHLEPERRLVMSDPNNTPSSTGVMELQVEISRCGGMANREDGTYHKAITAAEDGCDWDVLRHIATVATRSGVIRRVFETLRHCSNPGAYAMVVFTNNNNHPVARQLCTAGQTTIREAKYEDLLIMYDFREIPAAGNQVFMDLMEGNKRLVRLTRHKLAEVQPSKRRHANAS